MITETYITSVREKNWYRNRKGLKYARMA